MAEWSHARRLVCVAVCILAAAAGFGEVPGQSKPTPPLLSFTLSPSFNVPMGSDANLFSFGGGGVLNAEYRMPFMPLFFLDGDVAYSWVPNKLTTNSSSFSLITGGLGAGVRLDFMDRLSLRVFGSGGYFYAFDNGASGMSGSNPYVSGGADLSWSLMPTLSLGLGASYRYFFGLYNDLSVFLGGSYILASGTTRGGKLWVEQAPAGRPVPLQAEPEKPLGRGLKLGTVQLSGVFPVFYKYYNDNPLGSAILSNEGEETARDIKVSFLVKQYMENAQTAKSPSELGPGQEAKIDVYGLFRSNILEVSEPTIVSANVTVEYTLAGRARKQEYTETLRINNRNAMNWLDDRRAAAFITVRDPTVMKFAKNVTAMLSGKASSSLNSKLLAAMGVHEALKVYGLQYVIDPTTPFLEYSQNKESVDFLQFPQQTLEFKAGDCDDLTILYSALLESLGVETALLTTPGHIFVAISLEMSPEDAKKRFTRPESLIFQGDRSWLPIEVTERKGDFLTAWDAGAREWRESAQAGQAGLYPVHEAWTAYEAVGFSSTVTPIPIPAEDQLLRAYNVVVSRFVDREVSARAVALTDQAKKAADPSKAINRLGVLYSQYGLLDRAEKEFAKLAGKEYVPALLNLGNIYFTRGDLKGALAFYNRAQKKDPRSAVALLGVARVQMEMENFDDSRAAYAQVQALDPGLASKFSYLGQQAEGSTRAGQAGKQMEEIVWSEEN
jgi:hypothetical protein